MIKVSDIILQVRKNEKDLSKDKYSDWEVLNALNESLRLVANHFSMMNTDFLEKSVKMLQSPIDPNLAIPVENEARQSEVLGDVLPEDFIVEVAVYDLSSGYKLHPATTLLTETSYQIYQNAIFALEPIVLKYRCSIPAVEETSEINLPVSFFDFLVRTTQMALGEGTVETLDQFVAENAMKLIPGRRYANARQRLPWRV